MGEWERKDSVLLKGQPSPLRIYLPMFQQVYRPYKMNCLKLLLLLLLLIWGEAERAVVETEGMESKISDQGE